MCVYNLTQLRFVAGGIDRTAAQTGGRDARGRRADAANRTRLCRRTTGASIDR